MKIQIISLLALATLPCRAQRAWTARQCMQYAVEHNHEVVQSQLELDNLKASRTAAIGCFLPSVDGSIGVQYNFGRAIDPATNGYTDVSTFYNGYSLSASVPVFDGLSRLHALRAANASVLMGREALRQQQDATALNALRAFVDVAYNEGMVGMAEEKLEEARLMLRQTRMLEEVGRKSAADVALMESQEAEANYELTNCLGRHASAVLALKNAMAFPFSDSLTIAVMDAPATDALPSLSENPTGATVENAELRVAQYRMQVRRHELREARADLFPSISLGAGVSTSYYRMLHTPNVEPFHDQFHNNMGEYVSATLRIPLFNRMQTLTNIRRARNSYRQSIEDYEAKCQELEKLSREAWQDLEAYRKKSLQMEKKVEADSLAHELTRRQYEEGLATAIDLHSTQSALLQSRATLLQCHLMVMVEELLTKYYKGETIWTE